MKHDRYIQLVEQLLYEHSKDKTFKDVKDYIIWQRGFLTGFLASVARDDFYAEGLIKKSIKKKTGRDI
jgi:methionine salvage enolase-phosphatase E1